MKPASSVLLLTTLTGFGYGLLAWMGVFDMFGWLPDTRSFGPVAILTALCFASAGLVASTMHLGRPERAWRAFSQWRSSWLAREGLAAAATNVPALGFAISWWISGPDIPLTVALGLCTGVMALLTIGCTAMIYASLKPIRQWHNAHTLPGYLIYGAFSGILLLTLILGFSHGAVRLAAGIGTVLGITGLIAKRAYWAYIDSQTPMVTLASALGFSSGLVRPLDLPHFTENFILREMGFRIARRHRTKLRRLVILVAFAIPIACASLAALGVMPEILSVFAAMSAGMGLFIERWLFFAEATHVAAVYYGRAA